MMKQATLILLFAFAAVSAFACANPTNCAVVVYCEDCEDLCAPSATNSPSVAWSAFAEWRSNWGYLTGDGDSSCQGTVTYSAAFAAVPDVSINCAGSTNAVPANRGDARAAPNYTASAQVLKTNQFTVIVTDIAGGNIATNTRVLFTWMAKPAGSD
jgi:hypothetical protein